MSIADIGVQYLGVNYMGSNIGSYGMPHFCTTQYISDASGLTEKIQDS